MAGIDGIKNKIDPVREKFGPYDFNLYNLSKSEQKKIRFLPQSLDEALNALVDDHGFLMYGGVFPKRLIDIWLENKRKEAARYKQLPHPVEFETYFDL
jgi:glutamine synthetase